MENKFSIEKFVQDSVPSIEANDRDFRSISDEIDKRISTSGGSRSSIISDRIKKKLDRIRSTIMLDTEADEFSASGTINSVLVTQAAEVAASSDEDFVFEDDVTEEYSASENDIKGDSGDVWTGSVLDRLRAFGYINVAEQPASVNIEIDSDAIHEDVQKEEQNISEEKFSETKTKASEKNVERLFRQTERNENITRMKKAKENISVAPQQVVGYEKLSVLPKRQYVYPSVDLVRPDNIETIRSVDASETFAEETRLKAQKLVDTFKSFGIGITITGVTRGPSVTRFEFQPEIGVRISKIVALTDDIALSLAASAVRMEAPIPGKSAIGIEIPNETVDTVYFYDVINSNEYRNAKSKISFALGKDIEGKIIVADLAKMPHVLIAGSTGSGKSVCINTIISGILYGASPDEVKFIMIDPKVVELGMYNNIPHLLIPVVTEPKKAASALAWAVGEVERRYHLFAENSVRDIFSFNKGVSERDDMSHLEKMPQIVIIIDELADLMMVASQDVEKSIIRLAQKARAAGVHLVIATQRPSVDVITGLIKANIPSRIAFAVASSFDSRTILDSIGAEKLLGRGDMLYHPIGITKSKRIQGAFISEAEVERITEFVKNSYGAPLFDETVKQSIERAAEEMQKGASAKAQKNDACEELPDADEELVMMAAELGLKQKQLSASNLQRKLKLGYSRAARIIDRLEEMGFLTEADGSKPRQVLMTEAEWIEYNKPFECEDEAEIDEP